MLNLPTFRQITSSADLQTYAEVYESCSGLPVPLEYLTADHNQVFGLFLKGELISGFVLGHGPAFRTITVFAQEHYQSKLHEQFATRGSCTEICCFFIAPAFQLRTFFNFYTWTAMIYAQVRYGHNTFLYGTCSRSLAKLYSQTKETVLIHEDVVKGKRTFIFWAKRRYCVRGMLQIMRYKLKRVLKVSQKMTRRYSHG